MFKKTAVIISPFFAKNNKNMQKSFKNEQKSAKNAWFLVFFENGENDLKIWLFIHFK